MEAAEYVLTGDRVVRRRSGDFLAKAHGAWGAHSVLSCFFSSPKPDQASPGAPLPEGNAVGGAIQAGLAGPLDMPARRAK